MTKLFLTTVVLVGLTACNVYDPVSGARQDSRNEVLKSNLSPEGIPLPENIATTQVVTQ